MRSFGLSVLVLATGCHFVLGGVQVSLDGGVPAPGDDLAATIDLATTGATDAATMGGGSSDLATSTARRKAISIDKSKVPSTQTDFPLWIDLTDADIGARAQADGHDIWFTAADGTTRLDHELQSWNPTTHRLNAWVRVPTLDSKNTTTIYLRYGDATTAQAPNPVGVFLSSFAAVWHFDDANPTTTIADATGTHNGTPALTAATTKTTAQLGNGLAWTGSNDQITFTNNVLSGTQAHTISAWVNQSAGVTHPSAVMVVGPTGTPPTGTARWFYTHWTGPAMAVGYYTDDWNTTTNLDGQGWKLVHWVYEGGNNGKTRVYVNGVEIPGSPQSLSGINTTGTMGVIGHAPEPAYGTNMGFAGTLDELRIATVVRSPDWIAIEFANQSSPSTFYTVGPEQPVP